MKLGRLNYFGIATSSIERSVALGLRELRDKQLENLWKKHDNIPL